MPSNAFNYTLTTYIATLKLGYSHKCDCLCHFATTFINVHGPQELHMYVHSL